MPHAAGVHVSPLNGFINFLGSLPNATNCSAPLKISSGPYGTTAFGCSKAVPSLVSDRQLLGALVFRCIKNGSVAEETDASAPRSGARRLARGTRFLRTPGNETYQESHPGRGARSPRHPFRVRI